MPCYRPLRAYQGADGSVFFVERVRSQSVRTLDLPCGQCVGCRLERSRQWAIRCVHEAQMHELSCFVTLTYEDAPVSLEYRDFQLFMKRLRKVHGPVRFFACGEYGETTGRAHFHACLFGIDFADRKVFSTRGGVKLYSSATLDRLWGLGHCTVGAVTFESAAYVARYVMKKLTGDGEDTYYNLFDVETGEIIPRRKEFARMSLKPGIGAAWLERYQSDVYPSGECVVRGSKSKTPRYYDKWFKKVDSEAYARMLYEREMAARVGAEHNSDERLAVREAVAKARLSLLKRNSVE